MGCCGRSNSVKNDKFSTFSDACYTANVEKMQAELRKYNSNKLQLINTPNANGICPIHRVAQSGSVEALQTLLMYPVNVTAVTKTKETVLHIAAFHRKAAMIQALLATEARNTINFQEAQHGMTALHISIYRGSPEITKLLLEAGADPSLCNTYGTNALQLAHFWVIQNESGLSSPMAKHQNTYDVVKLYENKLSDTPTTRANDDHILTPPSSVKIQTN